MSIEKALIAQARPHMLAARVQSIIEKEVSKGCRPDIAPHPVALEPAYQSITYTPDLLTGQGQTDHIPESTPLACDLIRLQLWISPEEKFSWLDSELFLKQLRTLSHRMAFEILGNSAKIQIQLLIHRNDLPIIQTAFRGQFERCELSGKLDKLLSLNSWADVTFLDCFPSPPYSP
jgi:hypothetical protein